MSEISSRTSLHESLHSLEERKPPSYSFPNIQNSKLNSFLLDRSLHTISERQYRRKSFWRPEYSGLVVPSTQCCQRYLEYLWEERKLQKHVDKIITATPKIDTKPPLLTGKCLFNSNVFRNTEDRLNKRYKENKNLVKRIAVASSSKRKNRVDCWSSFDLIRFNSVPSTKLLNRKVKRENVMLLERLMSTSPTKESHRAHLQEEYNKNQKLSEHLRKFPKIPSMTASFNEQSGKIVKVSGDSAHSLPPIKKSSKL